MNRTHDNPAEHRQTLSNNLLAHLRPHDFELLARHLRPLRVEAHTVLYDHGDNVETVYFPCGPTLASYLVTTEEGGAVETLMIGREGAIGGIVSQGRLPAYARTMVQFGGEFLTVPVSILDEAKMNSRTLDNLFARYADCMVAQIFQATACNAVHSIEQRAAKWIIAAVERTDSSIVPLTQERLSSMLGVGRSYLSRIIKTFKQEGILKVRRGHLIIVDQERLARKSCSCNEAVKSHFNHVLQGIYPAQSEDHLQAESS